MSPEHFTLPYIELYCSYPIVTFELVSIDKTEAKVFCLERSLNK